MCNLRDKRQLLDLTKFTELKCTKYQLCNVHNQNFMKTLFSINVKEVEERLFADLNIFYRNSAEHIILIIICVF